MLGTLKQLLTNQYAAALCTLSACIERCPEAAWSARVGNMAFCQVVYHTLFYADYYLGPGERGFRDQPFHRAHKDLFRDYEEFEDRAPVLLYDRPMIKSYLGHCRQKAVEVVALETAESLTGPSGFERRTFSRAELHVYNIRHIQHHAAQLSLRLRLDFGESIPWFGSGWRDS
jgi:hypothetical protein